ncbi:MAG: Tm-1-like ATP-binding domain-containing protein [Planctomycetes bacterium]|nr:Tm-1-like ATP-binding domain-containing protein [Planctomycetota bacterium]
MPVYLLGTLDTKGQEIAFVRDLLHEYGVTTHVVDTGCLGTPTIDAQTTREQVFEAAGVSLATLREVSDRGQAVTAAATGAANLIAAAHSRGDVDGVLALGGSAGTTIGTSAMRALPLGLPKLMVSTLASGQTRPYVGGKDILMLNAVVDIAGINRISRLVLGEAARAMAGMVTLGLKKGPDPLALKGSAPFFRPDVEGPASVSDPTDKPLIAATMFGVTTPCVEHARKILEAAGYEVLVFHATGNGGEAMEGLIADGLIAGVLDITTTELADELVGGILTAGPTRLTAAGKRGVPQVISVGALDMVNFGPRATVPEKFKDRKFYEHNANVTLMRTTVEENRKLGEEIGRKAAAATGPTCIMIPLKGVSAIDQTGKAFDDSVARQALYDGIRATHGSVELIEMDNHINDGGFAETSAWKLLELICN